MGQTRPNKPKKGLKLLRLALYAGAGLVFFGAGAFSAGLLWREESVLVAILLFLATAAGAAGSLFFFFLCLRQISPKPKDPFIATLP
jgi:apolipoprotein N-acyltransferase